MMMHNVVFMFKILCLDDSNCIIVICLYVNNCIVGEDGPTSMKTIMIQNWINSSLFCIHDYDQDTEIVII